MKRKKAGLTNVTEQKGKQKREKKKEESRASFSVVVKPSQNKTKVSFVGGKRKSLTPVFFNDKNKTDVKAHQYDPRIEER